MKVKAISLQKEPVIHMLHPGREVWNGQGLGIEANLFQTISKQVKGLKNIYMTHGAVTIMWWCRWTRLTMEWQKTHYGGFAAVL